MQVGTNTLSNISPNFTTPAGSEDYMNSEKNLKKASENSEKEGKSGSRESNSPLKLSEDEERLVKDLQSRDGEVRAHEAAHKSGGASTGAASYTYQQGPDGRMYAIGGEVSVSMKSGSTPDETIANAQAVIASAMAPANPSPQDYSVASSARMMMVKAQQQKAKEIQESMMGKELYKNEAINNKEDSKSAEDDSIKGSSGIDIPA